jgi:beta-galactosidase/beta-glucuronidase
MNAWKSVPGHIMTEWSDAVDPACPLPEYPRPQLVRGNWQNLNGLWEYCIADKNSDQPEVFTESILVPFALESALSGVKKPLRPDQRLWYRRSIQIPDDWLEKTILLHFEAVDWQCTGYLNGHPLGTHTGGYVPFGFDITDYVKPGANELVLSVWDPTDSHWQQRGKQALDPKIIYYTATSGIWQTVWMEAVDRRNHIWDLRITPDIEESLLSIFVKTDAPGEVNIEVFEEGDPIADIQGSSEKTFDIPIPHPRLWCPDDPFLYDLRVSLYDNGKVVDTVESYAGMRKITISKDAAGHQRVFLNNTPIFLHGPLDQGYWPEGGMTPPCEDALRFDLQKIKELGFNMVRKHVKVESRRWYALADRIGLVVIQDMINGGKSIAINLELVLTFLLDIQKKDHTPKAYKKAGRDSVESRQDFERELMEMINHLYNVPSVLVWVPFNEFWGQFDAALIAEFVKKHDPTRLLDHASGWYDQNAGDFTSRHRYILKLKKPPANDQRVYFISEYGGYSFLEPGHVWDESANFGYKKFKDPKALSDAYTNLIRKQIIPLIPKGLGAAVYTQLSDVEIECNGFFTYDRKMLKIDADLVKTLNEEIYSVFNTGEDE